MTARGPSLNGTQPLDPDELFVMGVGLIATTAAAATLLRWLIAVHPVARRPSITAALVTTPAVCLVGLFAVLRTLADPQVRDHGQYVALFLLAGGAVLALAVVGLPVVLGVSVRDDAVERRNGPATALAAGAIVAVTAVYAGANVGTGPTVWTTFGPAALGLVTLALLSLAHAEAAGLTEAVTVDRDPAAAARAVGLHLATAVVLARAVAGDWVSVDATLSDLARRGWPAVALVAVAIGVDRWQGGRPWATRRRLTPAAGVAAGYVMVATAWAVVGRR